MDLARVRPTSPDLLLRMHGVGERKQEAYGSRLIEEITGYCQQHQVTTDVAVGGGLPRLKPQHVPRMTAAREQAHALFAEGMGLDDVAQRIARARSTTCQYLVEWIRQTGPASVAPWVDDATYQRICDAIQTDDQDIRAIIDRLGGEVSYDDVRIVLAHRAATAAG